MKSICNLFLMAVFALSLGLVSCDEEGDPAKPYELDWSKKAILKGKIEMIDDQGDPTPIGAFTTDGSLEDYFIVSIPFEQLFSDIPGDYILPASKIAYYEATGEFTIEVPVGVHGTNITVSMTDFWGYLILTSESLADVLWLASNLNTYYLYDVHPGDEIDLSDDHEWILDGDEMYEDFYYKIISANEPDDDDSDDDDDDI